MWWGKATCKFSFDMHNWCVWFDCLNCTFVACRDPHHRWLCSRGTSGLTRRTVCLLSIMTLENMCWKSSAAASRSRKQGMWRSRYRSIKWLVMLVRVYISHPQRDFPDHPVKCHSLITSRHFNGTKFYQILCYLYIFLLSDSSKSM